MLFFLMAVETGEDSAGVLALYLCELAIVLIS
jgi:hypothetical protein